MSSRQSAIGAENSARGVRAIRTRPDRVIFVTDGEPDAWIASDRFVDLSP